jgi:hypothetical protein
MRRLDSLLQRDLTAMAARDGEQVEVDGALYLRHEPGTVRYFTLVGAFDIERWTYREIGVRNGPTLVPLEREAGLVERTTPALGFRIALGYAKDHMRSCAEDMTADHRCPPSRSTLERTAKAIGTADKQVAPRLRRAERVPEGTVARPRPHVGAHGGGCAGRRHARDAAQDTDEALRPQATSSRERQLPHGLCRDRQLPRRRRGGVGHGRYSAAAHESPTDRLVRPMMADLRHARQQAPTLAVGVVQDGAPELWNLLGAAVAADPLVTTYYEAIDRYHLNGRLADVLRHIEPDVAVRKARLSQWNESLDRNDRAIYQIRDWVRHCYADAITRDDATRIDQLDPHLTYLENNAHLMHYARLRQVGLPVGSGVTESACKSVIEMRTNGSSQRWRPQGLEAVLTLRSMHMSDRLPRFWANFARGYRKEIGRCA